MYELEQAYWNDVHIIFMIWVSTQDYICKISCTEIDNRMGQSPDELLIVFRVCPL